MLDARCLTLITVIPILVDRVFEASTCLPDRVMRRAHWMRLHCHHDRCLRDPLSRAVLVVRPRLHYRHTVILLLSHCQVR